MKTFLKVILINLILIVAILGCVEYYFYHHYNSQRPDNFDFHLPYFYKTKDKIKSARIEISESKNFAVIKSDVYNKN